MKANLFRDEKDVLHVIYIPENMKEQMWKLDMKKLGIEQELRPIVCGRDGSTSRGLATKFLLGWEDFVLSGK